MLVDTCVGVDALASTCMNGSSDMPVIQAK